MSLNLLSPDFEQVQELTLAAEFVHVFRRCGHERAGQLLQLGSLASADALGSGADYGAGHLALRLSPLVQSSSLYWPLI